MTAAVKCIACGEAIPAERLEALPGVATCVRHSLEKPRRGFMVSEFSKGTAPALVVVPQTAEAMRVASRVHKRSR